MISKGITLTRHLLDDRTPIEGDLGALLIKIGTVSKLISREVNRAALHGKLG